MINANCKLTVTKIGNQNTPLIIVDDFLSDPDEMVAAASKGPGFRGFDISESFYPGQNAPLMRSHVEAIMTYSIPHLIEHYDIPANMQVQLGSCYYGLVTYNPEQLCPEQCFPHIDTSGEFYFVALLYLNDEDFGGTSFYRHNPTGSERVTADQVESCFVDTKTVQGTPGYYDGNGDFEVIGQAEYKKNRLVLYPSNLLHCVNIKDTSLLNTDPSKGRLTANILSRFVLPEEFNQNRG